MNDRIRELAKQCRYTYESDRGVYQEFDEQKFAQLIVEECAQRAEAYAYMSANFSALAEELRRMVDVK